MEHTSRRNFLVACTGGLGAVVAAAMSWPVFRYLSPIRRSDASGKVVIPEKDLAEGEAKFFEFAGSSAVAVRKKGGEVIALSAVCTHLGCIVQWEKDKQGFLCPCHGGYYSADGAVTAGPPPRPLPKLPVTVANGAITIG